MPQKDVEEYIEAVLDLGGGETFAKTGMVAARLGVTPASVTEVFRRLDRDGIVRYEPYNGVQLTETGLKLARKLKRRHRLLEVLLEKVLGMKNERVHEEACKMEHALSEETERAICHTLGGPAECPHGSDIPPCSFDVESCNNCISELDQGDSITKKRKKDVVPLTSLKRDKKGRIAFIKGGKSVVQRLSVLGLISGTVISQVRSAPLKGPVEIRVRGYNLILGRGIAEMIFVEIDDE